MSVTSNKNTAQSPLVGGGATGAQVLKYIAASRIYAKSPDPISAAVAPSIKSAGYTPQGWTDLGVVEGPVKMDIQKKTKTIKTGVDGTFRASYADDRTAMTEFTLSQLDDIVVQQITGLTPTQLINLQQAGYGIGAEDVNPMALLIVVQNKLDGKELQFYNPAALLNFSIENQNDALEMKVTGMLPYFTPLGASNQCLLSLTVFSSIDGPQLSTLGDNTLNSFGDISLDQIHP